MANQQWPQYDEPGEAGPDYVALVIEWDDAENNVTQTLERPAARSLLNKLALGAGALGALLFAGWGVHRFRHG